MWITRFQAEYLSPCYSNVDLQFTPVNVFLGRNNSGKSRLLELLANIAAFDGPQISTLTSTKVTSSSIGQHGAGELATNIKWEHDTKLVRSNAYVSPFRYLPVDRTPPQTLDTRDTGTSMIVNQNLMAQSTGVQDLLKELHEVPQLRPRLQYEIEHLFGMSLQFEYQQYNLNVYAEDVSSARKFLLNAHGRGLQYFVALFFYLYHPGVQVLFVDEPENSLHPQLQRALIERIRSIAREQNKQVFLATHSPLFALPSTIDDLAGIFLLQRHPQSRIQPLSSLIPTDDDERRKFESYLPNLNTAIAELFFATGVFIVEGQTERQFVQYIATRTGRDLAQRGITVIESGGLRLMPKMIQLARQIVPHWRAICDGDLFTRGDKKNDPFSVQIRPDLAQVLGVEISHTNLEDTDKRSDIWGKGLFVLPKEGLEEYYVSPEVGNFLAKKKEEEPFKGWYLAQEIEYLESKDSSFIDSTYSDILAPLDALIADVDATAFKSHNFDELIRDILYDDANKIHCETYRQRRDEEQLRKSLSQSRSLNEYDLQFQSFDAYQLLWKDTRGGYYRIRCEGVWYYVERGSQPGGPYSILRRGNVKEE